MEDDDENIANLPVKRSLVTALITTIGGFVVGYSSGFLSSTLQDLSELSDDRSFRSGSAESQLFGVSTNNYGCEKPFVRVADKNYIGVTIIILVYIPGI